MKHASLHRLRESTHVVQVWPRYAVIWRTILLQKEIGSECHSFRMVAEPTKDLGSFGKVNIQWNWHLHLFAIDCYMYFTYEQFHMIFYQTHNQPHNSVKNCIIEWLSIVRTFMYALISSIFSNRFQTILQQWLTAYSIEMT